MQPLTATEDPIPAKETANRLLAERVRLHSRALMRLPAIELVFLAALSLVLRPHVPLSVYLTWCAVVLAISASRAGLATWVRRGSWQSPPKNQNLIFNLLAWSSGAAYGIGSAVQVAYLPRDNLHLFNGIVMALPAIGLLIAKASRRSIMGYGLLIMVPMGWAWVDRYPQHGTVMPVILLLYVLLINLATRNTERVLAHISEASERKNMLVRQLETRHQEVTAAMEHAERSAENRTRVLASASHDLRQPLHALATYAAVLEYDTSRDMVGHIGDRVDKIISSLSDLLQKLLDLSQLIAGQVTLGRSEYSVSEQVERLIEQWRPAIEAKGLLLVTRIRPVQAIGDADALASIFEALLNNAFRFTEQGSIYIELSEPAPDQTCLLSITDTGIGIDPKSHQQIFEEYFQVGNLARDRQQGVGLGLAIAQRQAMLMGTRICVSSQPGRGSRFEIKLPLHPVETTSAALARPAQEPDWPPGPPNQASRPVPASPNPPSRPSLMRTSDDPEVREEYVYIHARAVAVMPGIHALVLLGMASQMTPFYALSKVAAWGLTLLAIDLARCILGIWVVRHADSGGSVRKYHLHFTILSLLSGCTLIGGWALLTHNAPPMQLAATAAALIIMPPLAVTLAQSSRWIQMAYTIPMLTTLAIVALPNGEPNWPLLPIACTMLGALIYLAALDVEKLVVKAVSLRRELDAIAQKLEASNDAIREAADRAERASALRIRALASASHDLRQPLNALSLCNAVLVTRPTPARMNQVIGTVRKIVRMLGGLLHNLLDLSRIESGNPMLSIEQIDLAHILADVCSEYEPAARNKGLRIQTELQPVVLACDPLAIGRIARNLMDNAIKFSEKGSITVRCSLQTCHEKEVVVIEVSDTGPGIPPEKLQHIFDEYVQLQTRPHKEGDGVGLGLSIVKSLTLLMDGTIEVQSSPGKGSCFRLKLPVNPVQANEHLLESGALSRPFSGRRVLAIDDDVYVADSMRLLLTAWGMDCFVALDAQQAEAYLEQSGLPDLMLLDLRLPGPEHGATLGARLQTRFGKCPVIVITGETADDSVAEAIRLGYRLLKKPVVSEQLHATLQEVLTATSHGVQFR